MKNIRILVTISIIAFILLFLTSCLNNNDKEIVYYELPENPEAPYTTPYNVNDIFQFVDSGIIANNNIKRAVVLENFEDPLYIFDENFDTISQYEFNNEGGIQFVYVYEESLYSQETKYKGKQKFEKIKSEKILKDEWISQKEHKTEYADNSIKHEFYDIINDTAYLIEDSIVSENWTTINNYIYENNQLVEIQTSEVVNDDSDTKEFLVEYNLDTEYYSEFKINNENIRKDNKGQIIKFDDSKFSYEYEYTNGLISTIYDVSKFGQYMQVTSIEYNDLNLPINITQHQFDFLGDIKSFIDDYKKKRIKGYAKLEFRITWE